MGPCMHPQQHAPCMHTHTKHTHTRRQLRLSIYLSIYLWISLSVYIPIYLFFHTYLPFHSLHGDKRTHKKSTRLPAAEGQRAVAVASGAPGIGGLPFSMYLCPKGFIRFRLMYFVRFIVYGLGFWFGLRLQSAVWCDRVLLDIAC